MFEKLYNLNLADDDELMPILSLEEDDEASIREDFPEVMPILALKNTVLFPGIIIPITVGRQKSIEAIEEAYKNDRIIGVLSQKDIKVEAPTLNDLYKVGTIARILKLLKMPDGTITAILQGRKRFSLIDMLSSEPFLLGKIEILEISNPSNKIEYQALMSSIKDLANKIIELSPNIPGEATAMLNNITNDSFLLNFISSNLGVDIKIRQSLLEFNDINEKAHEILKQMTNELQLLEVKDKIENKVRGDMEKQQRDYFLNQQLKTIQDELGQNPQTQEIEDLIARAKKKNWNDTVRKIFDKEISKIKRTNPQAPEYSVLLNHAELLVDLPWNEYTEDNFDLRKVKKELDKEHFGMTKVKERILEHLAVLKLKGDMKAPIICLVGPPGVGKTSLGRSIATAINRKYIRMSLGGLHDESEIRGHRKTYIGAMPGRVIQSIKKAKSSNPVFILDEIDKVGKDFRGDPSSALLEVLDPEQNSTFHDNYLDTEYDLSKVLFIATANSLNTIQPALLDRMEIIEVSGYSTEEKVKIAKQHLIPQERKEHGLKAKQVKLTDSVIEQVIQDYTRESGVRSLKRQIAGIMRKVAKYVALEETYDISIKKKDLHKLLGPTRYSKETYSDSNVVGVTIGLAWTSVGGEILFIESNLSEGKGNLTLTGNLGDVMKESATTALSFLKSNASKLGIDSDIFNKKNIHIHVPAGAIPKDGPSAGITMLTALASSLTQKKVKPYIAMTGEITLRGKVLPVGGIKEKILAAKRAGMKTIILCIENKKHVEEIEAEYIKGLTFHYVDKMEQVLKIALGI